MLIFFEGFGLMFRVLCILLGSLNNNYRDIKDDV